MKVGLINWMFWSYQRTRVLVSKTLYSQFVYANVCVYFRWYVSNAKTVVNRLPRLPDYQCLFCTRVVAVTYRWRLLYILLCPRRSPCQCLPPIPRLLGLRNKTLYHWHNVTSGGCQEVSCTGFFPRSWSSVLTNKTLFACTSILAPPRSVPAIRSNTSHISLSYKLFPVQHLEYEYLSII